MAGTAATLRGFFDDPAVRHGIKFGLAAVFSVAVALTLRLDEPVWALITVFVIMLAQYVGAIAEKSILRIIGTVIGGILGYLITGALEQNAVVFLGLSGLVVGFCTMMFGQTRFPYAFLLCGLTVMIVTANGMADPAMSWRVALARIEEVTIAVIVCMAVNGLVWPRYARREFLSKFNAALGTVAEDFRNLTNAWIDGSPSEAARSPAFNAALVQLRTLMHFGGRESRNFRVRSGVFAELITLLGRVSGAIDNLPVRSIPHPLYVLRTGDELRAHHNALVAGLEMIARLHEADTAARRECLAEIERTGAALRERMTQLRREGVPSQISPEAAMDFCGHWLSLDEVRIHLGRMVELLDCLEKDPFRPPPDSPVPAQPPLSAFWIHNGIRSGLAIVLGLLVINWFDPPGGSMVALAAWLFTATSRLYPGGEGDRRAFHYFAMVVLIGIAYVPVMILLAPLLSSYAILNLWLFVSLFVFGYLTFAVPGINFPMQIALLMTVGTLGLNAQEPVSIQQILDVPLGLSIGLLISAVVQRLFWPVLPQYELRDGFHELLAHCKAILRQGVARDTFWRSSRLALLPVEITNWLHTLTTPDCPKDEPQRLRAYLESLQHTACAIIACAQRLRPLIPPRSRDEADRALSALEDAIEHEIAEQQTNLLSPRNDSQPTSDSALESARSDWSAFVAKMRESMLASDTPVTISLPFLGLADRYDRACDALIEARNRAAKLRLNEYMGDYAL